MIKIQPGLIEKINTAKEPDELFEMLQGAIELEHSTIPPYLTAMFSLKPHTEIETQKIIHSIVKEEMLHMTIVANILNALGGSPQILKKNFVPAYPCNLPMGIGHGLVVGIEKYSIDLVKNVFMEIEEPENPLVLKAALTENRKDFNTIGEFYMALQEKIMELAPDVLPGNPARQVTSEFFPGEVLCPIKEKKDVVKAIGIIVEQGEGTSSSPADFEDEIAHYYKFEELYKGKKLIKDPTAPHGYSYSGPDIPFDSKNVFPLFPNTKSTMVKDGTEERHRLEEFRDIYASLLMALHKTFNGAPWELSNAIGVMYDLKLSAEKLCATPFPGKPGYHLGPASGYKPTFDIMKNKIILPLFITGLIILAVFLIFGNLETFFLRLLDRAGANHFNYSIVSLCILVADIILPVPSSVVMYTNGYILGVVFGALLSLLSLLAGSVIGYYIGRLTSNGLKQKSDSYSNELINRYGALSIIVTRGIPIVSESVCIMCGYNRMPFNSYLFMNFIGYVPVAFLYAICGNLGYSHNSFLLSFICSIIISVIYWIFGQRLINHSTSGKVV